MMIRGSKPVLAASASGAVASKGSERIVTSSRKRFVARMNGGSRQQSPANVVIGFIDEIV